MESVGGSSLALPNLLAIPRRIQAGWSPAGDAPLPTPFPLILLFQSSPGCANC